jgi:hypothetical protein
MEPTWDCQHLMMNTPNLDQMRTISVGKTESGLLVVFQEKIEENTERESEMKSVILDPQDFIGKSEDEAIGAIKEHCVFRVAERDGKSYEINASYLPFRWNLYINDGKISNIRMF